MTSSRWFRVAFTVAGLAVLSGLMWKLLPRTSQSASTPSQGTPVSSSHPPASGSLVRQTEDPSAAGVAGVAPPEPVPAKMAPAELAALREIQQELAEVWKDFAEPAADPLQIAALKFRDGLQTVLEGQRNIDCLGLVDSMEILLTAISRTEDHLPAEIPPLLPSVEKLCPVLFHVAASEVKHRGGELPREFMEILCRMFSQQGFLRYSTTHSLPLPLDQGGLMILDAPWLTVHLQSLPPATVREFMGGQSAAGAFLRYEAGGGGLPVLSRKYAADPEYLHAKWTELENWLSENYKQ